MVKEAVILAGGFGTRLGSVIKNIPKPMAEVAGRVFLEYVLDLLNAQHLKRVILAVGYKHNIIEKHFGGKYRNLEIVYSVEEEPLGTGGAVMKSLEVIEDDVFFIINGDTYFDVSLSMLYQFYMSKCADLSVALKPLHDSSRYGSVELDISRRITGFSEKGVREEGLINGGIYLLRGDTLRMTNLATNFSF